MRRDPHWLDQDWCVWSEFGFANWVVLTVTSFPVTLWNPSICPVESMVNEIFRSPNPKGRGREFHPCANQRQERQVQLLLSCVKQMSASCTSNLLVRMFDFRKYTRDHPMLILSLQSLLQNQNLETVPICTVVLCLSQAILPEFTCVMNV